MRNILVITILFLSRSIKAFVPAAVAIVVNLFLPLKEDMPVTVNIPSAITKFYALPEETMMKAFARGNEYLLLGRFRESLIEFDRAVELSPTSAEIYLARGITEEKLNLWERAISDYLKANALIKEKSLFKRDDAVCLSNLANAETGAGRWKEAQQHFAAAISLKANFEAPVIGNALALYQLGREEESYEIVRGLVSKFPSFADGRAMEAVMDFKKGKIESALANFEDTIELDARYYDIEWVRSIRRWSPRLVDDLSKLLADNRVVKIVEESKEQLRIDQAEIDSDDA